MQAIEKKKTAKVVRENLVEYGKYVVEERAIADVRDGLKPVQRRILWSLHELKRYSKDLPVKCATVIGNCIGKFHPHGDSACYGALVTMAWMHQPLVQKHGNFGARESLMVDAELAAPAAYRYTETRLSEFADRIFDDIKVMPLVKSFTEEHEEPFLLPTRVPLLLVNGCIGVAWGVGTAIPPHNLEEVVNATLEVLENPECDVGDLLKHIKGPDYGYGVLLSRKDDLRKLYETGTGRLSFSCNYHFEEAQKGKQLLVITGFNPGFNAKKLVEETELLLEAKLLESAANDESSLETGTRVVIEFTDPKIINDRVMPKLRSTVSYQFLALDNKKQPRLYNLKSMIEVFLRFRRKVERMVLEDARLVLARKLSVENAKLIAIDNLKIVLDILQTATSSEAAIDALVKQLGGEDGLDREQAQIILDTSLRSLIRKSNRNSILERIAEHATQMKAVLEDLDNIDAVVARRLKEMLGYSIKRGTRLRGGKEDLDTTEASATYYVGVTEDRKIDSFTELPLKSKAAWKYVNFVETSGKFAVISDDNVGQSIALSFLDKFDKSVGNIIGMASEQHDCMIAISRDAQYVAFPPDQRRTRFNVFKETPAEQFIFVGGMKQGDTLLVTFDDDDGKEYALEDLKITRPNVSPKKLPGLGKRKLTVQHANVVPADVIVVDPYGNELGRAEQFSEEAHHYIGENNLVVIEAGSRMLQSEEDVLQLLQKNQNTPVQFILPLPEKA